METRWRGVVQNRTAMRWNCMVQDRTETQWKSWAKHRKAAEKPSILRYRHAKDKQGKVQRRNGNALFSQGKQRLGKEGKCNVSFIPTCPNGHTMELRVSRRRSGDMHMWDALYMCRCGWVSPKISSTDLNVAERGAMERTGVTLIPDDHIMTESEVKAFVRSYIVRRS